MRLFVGSKTKKKVSMPPGLELDCLLAAQIAGGSRDALTQLIDRHAGPLYKYLERRLGPGHDELIADIVAATFESAMRRLRPYAQGKAKRPMNLWLLTLAEKHLARRKDLAAATVPGNDPALAALRSALNSIPRRDRPVLALALFEELSADELAAATGISLSRAMRKLRHAIRKTGLIVASTGEAAS